MVDPIDRVASAVSDGKAVDWVREKSARPDRLEEFDQLALVERIRRVHDAAAVETPITDIRATAGTETRTKTETWRTPDAEAGPTPLFTWGRLQVLEKVGEGGGGEVFRAIDPSLKSEVALKLLRPDYADSPQLVRRFLDEGRRLARVRHQNILTVHGADQHDGRAGLWTEFVHGKSLEIYIAEQGALSACEAAVVGLDLCRALAAVHAAGLVHRDVKTTNVMREDGGRIVLMDFGSVAESPGGSGLWTAGVQGTPISMAPEQLRGEVAGPATDVYGLGVLLYRLVTRKYPIEATSLHELQEKHRGGAQVPLRDRRPDLPLEFVQVVERALHAEPAARYASTGAMERDLSATLGAMARQSERRRRTNRIVLAAVGGIAILGGILIGVGLRDQGVDTVPPPPTPNGQHAAPAPAPLAANLTLLRRTGETEQTLVSGGRVAPGDRLSLLLQGTDSMWVYVLNEDEQGEVFGLYPIPGLLPTNPLDGKIEHRLPGDLGGEVVYWNVTSAGGRESIVAIGSRAPLPDLEKVIADLPRATPGRPIRFGKVNPMALRTLRGLGSGTAMEPPRGEARRRLQAALEGLEARGKESGDIWVWSIELENPPRP